MLTIENPEHTEKLNNDFIIVNHKNRRFYLLQKKSVSENDSTCMSRYQTIANDLLSFYKKKKYSF